MTMMLPTKSALLKMFKDEGEMWDYEAVEKIQQMYSVPGDYWKFTLRFYMMELSGGGMLEVCREEIDDGSHFKSDTIVCRYRITDFGAMRVETLLE